MIPPTVRMVGTLLVVMGVAGLLPFLPVGGGPPSSGVNGAAAPQREPTREQPATMSADEAPRELSPAEGDVEAEAFGSPDQGDWLDAEASDAGAWSDDQELSEDGDSPDDEDWLEADETQPGE